MDVEASAGQLEGLDELRALPQAATGSVLETGVDRNPVLETPRIHYQVVYPLWRRVDLD
jgi:hypothetical protein